MKTAPRDSSNSTPAVHSSRLMRERMLSAMRELETALATASPQREASWRERVTSALATLGETMAAQSTDLRDSTGLLAELLDDEPRLAPHVEALRRKYEGLFKRVRTLEEQFATNNSEAPAGIADMRQELSQLVGDLREFQFEETDLIYEAIQVDIGAQD